MDDSLFDPLTLNTALQSLPEIQQRQRRVSQLRDAQNTFQALGQQQGAGNYTPAQQGGLFPTVQQWQPDYKQAGNQMMGAIGQMISNRQANTAEDQLNQVRNTAIMQGLQQGGGQQGGGGGGQQGAVAPNQLNPNAPLTATALRGYLSLIGGPDMKDIIGQIPHVANTIHDDKTGKDFIVMSDGTMRDVGTTHAEKSQLKQDANGVWKQVWTTGPHAGEAVDLNTSGAPAGQQRQGPPGQQIQNNPNWTPGYNVIHSLETADGGIGNVSPKGARGPAQLMPDTARELEKRFGFAPGSSDTDPDINNFLGDKYYQDQLNEFKDPAIAAIAYNQGPEATRQWLKPVALGGKGGDPNALPDETKNYYQAFGQRMGGGPTAVAATATGPNGQVTVGTGGGLQGIGPVQRGYGTQHGKNQANLEDMPALNAYKVALDGMKKEQDFKTELKNSLPSLKVGLNTYVGQIDELLNNPNLANITGDAKLGRALDTKADTPETRALLLNPANAHALALWDQIKSMSAIQGLKDMKAGGVSRITNMEFGKDAQAVTNLSHLANTADAIAELKRLRGHFANYEGAMEAYSNAPVQIPNVEGLPTRPSQGQESASSGDGGNVIKKGAAAQYNLPMGFTQGGG